MAPCYEAGCQVARIESRSLRGSACYSCSGHRVGSAIANEGRHLFTRVVARDVEFYPSALEEGVRSERALKLAVAAMYVQGVSTREVAAIAEQLCGLEVTSAQVSRAAEALDEELEKWRARPLGETPYLILDARYEEVRPGGAVVPCAVPVAIGIDPQGK